MKKKEIIEMIYNRAMSNLKISLHYYEVAYAGASNPDMYLDMALDHYSLAIEDVSLISNIKGVDFDEEYRILPHIMDGSSKEITKWWE